MKFEEIKKRTKTITASDWGWISISALAVVSIVGLTFIAISGIIGFLFYS